MSNYDTSIQATETAQEAAKILRRSLDPAQTTYDKYERLMLDLDWPLILASALEEAASQHEISVALLYTANRIIAVSNHASWTPRP